MTISTSMRLSTEWYATKQSIDWKMLNGIPLVLQSKSCKPMTRYKFNQKSLNGGTNFIFFIFVGLFAIHFWSDEQKKTKENKRQEKRKRNYQFQLMFLWSVWFHLRMFCITKMTATQQANQKSPTKQREKNRIEWKSIACRTAEMFRRTNLVGAETTRRKNSVDSGKLANAISLLSSFAFFLLFLPKKSFDWDVIWIFVFFHRSIWHSFRRKLSH